MAPGENPATGPACIGGWCSVKRTTGLSSPGVLRCDGQMEAPAGFEPANTGFADPGLTTWRRRRSGPSTNGDAHPSRAGGERQAAEHGTEEVDENCDRGP